MTLRTIIPRFLLPLQGPLWRGVRIPLSQNVLVRFASSSSSSSDKAKNPLVLEKPTKFNPPSHGSRLKRNSVPRHYGPELTASEVTVQEQKDYPGLMAPKGTWAHWLWHNTMIHMWIMMGTLFILAVYTFFMNYVYNSPFKDLIPPISDLWTQPLSFIAAWTNVISLDEEEKSRKAYESKMKKLDDLAKRRYYMKVHGIETKNPVMMAFGSKKKEESIEELEAAALGREYVPPEGGAKEDADAGQKKKKWFGIW
ncbi:hypothetical protein E4U25_003814 [Claviceps purpurea]|nr:hypothetical protein E4U25_003814 [Claviceps purpurea]